MKLFKRFLLLGLFFAPCVCGAQVATTAGSNLTAWNSGGGSANNNNWNTLMNNRTLAGGAGGATADFGNCNSLILRCAQPKCSACTTMELARPIVEGCVNSNKDCKKHGTELVEFISGQIVANAAAKAQQQELAIKQAEAQAAAAQNSQQMDKMQQQMQQMQRDMQAQNAQQMQQMQAALDEQKALVAKAQQEAAAAQQAKIDAQTAPGVTVAQQAAINAGVSADVMVRQQITGQVMTEIENAEDALKDLKSAMLTAFEYAGCDTRGNSCTGPKRVKIFKDKANQFFDPYNTVLDSLYDALIIAQSVGVDITEIYLMLSDSCNSWGEYICTDTSREQYTECPEDETVDCNCKNGRSIPSTTTKGQHPCTGGQVIPAQDSPHCTMHRVLANKEDVQRGLLDPAASEDTMIRVGCASAALDASGLFVNRKKQASIDIDTLQRILEQDAPSTCTKDDTKFNNGEGCYKYCVSSDTTQLGKYVATKTLPKKVCVKDPLDNTTPSARRSASSSFYAQSALAKCKNKSGDKRRKCICDFTSDAMWDEDNQKCTCTISTDFVFVESLGCVKKDEIDTRLNTAKSSCASSGGSWNNGQCDCGNRQNVGGICRSPVSELFCQTMNGTYVNDKCMCGSIEMFDVTKNCVNGEIKDKRYDLTLPPITSIF